jgi:hypothetical protein
MVVVVVVVVDDDEGGGCLNISCQFVPPVEFKNDAGGNELPKKLKLFTTP